MILGYVDAEDRIYDLNFAARRMKLRIETDAGGSSVSFSRAQGGGEVRYRVLVEASVTVSVAMDHDGHPVPLLRPVEGRLLRHDAGLLFVASPRTRDPDDPGYFLVKVRAMPSAVKFFFEDQQGTEIVSIPRDEVLRVEPDAEETRIFVSAANVALPNEKIAYLFALRPPERLGRLLDGLAMSPSL